MSAGCVQVTDDWAPAGRVKRGFVSGPAIVCRDLSEMWWLALQVGCASSWAGSVLWCIYSTWLHVGEVTSLVDLGSSAVAPVSAESMRQHQTVLMMYQQCADGVRVGHTDEHIYV